MVTGHIAKALLSLSSAFEDWLVKAATEPQHQTVAVRADKRKWWPPLPVVLCGLLLGLSLLSQADTQALRPLRWLALLAVAVGIPPILFKAWTALRACHMDINVLMTLAVAGGLGMVLLHNALLAFGFPVPTRRNRVS